MIAPEEYRSDPTQPNPFDVNSQSGKGPHGSEWKLTHMQMLEVDLYDDLPIFCSSDQGVLPPSWTIDFSYCPLFDLLQREYGQHVDTITRKFAMGSDVWQQTEYLSRWHLLSAPPDNDLNPSSPVAESVSSQNTTTGPPLRRGAGSSFATSITSSSLAQERSLANSGRQHLFSRSSNSSQVSHTTPSPPESDFDADSQAAPSPSSPLSGKVPSASAKRAIGLAQMKVSQPSVKLNSSPTTERTHVGSPTSSPASLSGTSPVLVTASPPHTNSQASSDGYDGSYVPSERSESEGLDDDKDEIYVQYCARSWVRVIGDLILRIDERIQYDAVPTSACNIMVDSVTCSVTADVRFALGLEGKPSPKTVLLGEMKRKKHGRSRHNILGQELATLLSAMSPRILSASEKTHRHKDHDPLRSYIFSWHHFQGYICSLSGFRRDFEIIQNDISQKRWQPFKMRRSRAYNLKDGSERSEFLCAVAAICLRQMGNHSGLVGIHKRFLG